MQRRHVQGYDDVCEDRAPVDRRVVTAVDEQLTPTAWWGVICDDVDTRLRDLVEEYDQIAAQAIPYGWLPRRVHAYYGDAFITWSDLADETIASLLDRPRNGVSTVRAIVTAAYTTALAARTTPADEDAAAGARRLLSRLDDYDYQLLRTRRWALRPLTIHAAAAQIGANAVNVGRATPRAYRRFTELLADPSHAVVVGYARDLGRRLGSLTREVTAARALADLGVDIASVPGQMLLHVAGPYVVKNGWLEDPGRDALVAGAVALGAALDEYGAPTLSVLTEELGKHGIRPQMVVEFIDDQPGLRRFGDRWVRWGKHLLDRIEAVLRLRGAPADVATITAIIGAGCTEESVRNGLHQPRFTRATKLTWALREWGIYEYTSLYGEIAARIDAAGHPVSAAALVDEIMAAFPDVAEDSIRTFIGVPAFVTEGGMVRRRTAGDGWPTPAPLNTARGVFREGRNRIRLAVLVTQDVLRGSGHHLVPSVAVALGLQPTQERTFASGALAVTVSWPVSAVCARTGSLRVLAAAAGAAGGDTLVLVFNVHDSTLDVVRIPAGADLRQRLAGLLGVPVRHPAAALARALRCRPDELAGLLGRRRERDLLTLGG